MFIKQYLSHSTLYQAQLCEHVCRQLQMQSACCYRHLTKPAPGLYHCWLQRTAAHHLHKYMHLWLTCAFVYVSTADAFKLQCMEAIGQQGMQAGRQTKRLSLYLVRNTQLLGSMQETGLSYSASHPHSGHVHQCSLIWQICWQNLVALCGSAELAQGKSGSETLSCRAAGEGGICKGSGCQGCWQRPPGADVERPGSVPCCLQDAAAAVEGRVEGRC